MSNEVTIYEPRNLQELREFVGEVSASALLPAQYRGKPIDAMVAMMFGKEVAGLGPLTSLNFVAVINGKPSFFGDAVAGIAMAKGQITDMEEYFEGTPGELDWTAVCVVTRPSGSKVTQRFSVADARRAGLWGKQGPWAQYPRRMLQMRARSWAVRDAAPHMLFGPTVEEMEGHAPIGPEYAKDITPGPALSAAERRAAMVAVEPAPTPHNLAGETRLESAAEPRSLFEATVGGKFYRQPKRAADALIEIIGRSSDVERTLAGPDGDCFEVLPEEHQARVRSAASARLSELEVEPPLPLDEPQQEVVTLRDLKRAEELEEALRSAPTEDGLIALYRRRTEEIAALPTELRMKLAEAYEESYRKFDSDDAA